MTKPRKLVVDGKEYRYFVGKETTKVQDMETKKSVLYQNADYGTPIIACDYSYSSYPDYRSLQSTEPYRYIITPGVVAGMLKDEIYWKSHYCEKHPDQYVTGLCPSPYEDRINYRIRLMENCPKCVCDSAWAI